MDLPLPVAPRPRFGAMTMAFDGQDGREKVELAARLGFSTIWTGDHVAFTSPINDPLTQLAFFSAIAPELAFGTCVYLLPLRHPVPVAKMVATLDRLMGAGRLIFGVGVGGEFAREYQACGVALKERGARTNEAIPLIKRLWSEDSVAHQGRFYSFDAIKMRPRPLTEGGPPVWVGGRAEAPLRRAGRMADGWMPYVVTPERYRDGLATIAGHAARHGRRIESFGTGLLLFCTIDDSYEQALDVAAEMLSKRYAMDFREPARRYCGLGRPADVAATISRYIAVGVRDFAIDMIAPAEQHESQLERFAREVIPLVT